MTKTYYLASDKIRELVPGRGSCIEFLAGLQSVLPDGCCPILVTDAGFRGLWFRSVEARGWHWVGRIRNGIKYFNEATGRWCLTESLYKHATPVTRYVGHVLLSPRRVYTFHLYLVRAYAPLHAGRRKKDRGNNNARLFRRLHRAPWLLATSLPHHHGSERRIKQLYAQRMQIEQTFRDLKSHRFGFGLRYARSGSARRIQVLVLLTALAALVLWIAGLVGRTLNLGRHFQANTIRSRRVLSIPFLGRQILLKHGDLPLSSLNQAFDELMALTSPLGVP